MSLINYLLQTTDIANIDFQDLWNDAFAEGRDSVDIEEIKTTAYDDGYESGHDDGYDSGYGDGESENSREDEISDLEEEIEHLNSKIAEMKEE